MDAATKKSLSIVWAMAQRYYDENLSASSYKLNKVRQDALNTIFPLIRDADSPPPAWEEVTNHVIGAYSHGHTYRMKVPGGWIYRHQDHSQGDETVPAVAMVFVPDKEV